MNDPELNAAAIGAIDAQHPWLGLDSFTEQTRAYFFGRDEEVAELARRIQRKTLTVLFGQSGLGKTSILRAGLVPLLRPQGYCPVYVRISYAPEAPSPAEQIKQAILRATIAQGHWSQAGVSQAGETLWEFLHHRDDSLRDESGAPLTPLLIFDQFEEIFTLAQADDDGKRRVARFVEELADLVENRPPAALDARMELDDTLAAQFDFARDDYRVLISLREDYLAHLEGLRGAMPSITQNRMRLARMNGQQALAAVTKPGGRLVSEEVAQAIVRFIAGGAELANAEVEPSLLSLICRELNNQRIAQHRAEISTDLLAGSHAGILAEFYERVLSDMPDGVHRVIEDDLLTEAGYRENLAEERVLKAFAAAGAPPGALAVLVNRRLLRIEERLDVRRVELTHDVLCGVVLAARAQRHERQAREAAERQLEQQAQEQQRSRKALLRARRIAAGCVALAALAVAGGAYGYIKAREAEKTRGEAEALVGYLLDDFYVKLEPSGHIDLIGDLVDRAARYYRGLPSGVRNADTERNRAMVLLRQGQVLVDKGQFKAAKPPLDEAIVLLGRAVREGDGTGQSLLKLTEARRARGSASYPDGEPADALRFITQAVDGIRAAGTAPNASHNALLAYGRALRALGFMQSRTGAIDASLANLRDSQRALAYASHSDQDTAATLQYLYTITILHEVLSQSRARHDEGAAVGTEGLAVIDQMLAKEPANYAVINNKTRLLFNMAVAELQDRRPGQAIPKLRQSAAASEELLRLDPSQPDATSGISIDHEVLAQAYSRLGQVSESQAQTRQAYAMFDAEPPSAYQMGNLWITAMDSARLHADIGDREGVRDAMRLARKYSDGNLRNQAAQSPDRIEFGLRLDVVAADNDRVLGDPSATLDRCAMLVSRAESLPAQQNTDFNLDNVARDAFLLDAQVAFAQGDYARTAASAARARQEGARTYIGAAASDPDALIVQALALARLNRASEAQALILPLIREARRQIASGADDQFLRVELASSLLASALSDPSTRQASLREARQLLDALPTPMRSFNTVKLWRARIQEAQSGHA